MSDREQCAQPDHTMSLPAVPQFGMPVVLWLLVACPAAVYAIMMLRHQPRSIGGQLVVLPVVLALAATLELVRRRRRSPGLLLAVDLVAALSVLLLARSMLF